MINCNTLIRLLGVFAIAVLVLGCDRNGDDGPSLQGDLSYRVEGEEGLTVQITKESWDGETYNAATVESVELSGGSASGNLENGDYEGYRLQASSSGGASSSLTLQLLSDGEVLGETSEPNENGIWIVKEGEMPDYSEFE